MFLFFVFLFLQEYRFIFLQGIGVATFGIGVTTGYNSRIETPSWPQKSASDRYENQKHTLKNFQLRFNYIRNEMLK